MHKLVRIYGWLYVCLIFFPVKNIELIVVKPGTQLVLDIEYNTWTTFYFNEKAKLSF